MLIIKPEFFKKVAQQTDILQLIGSQIDLRPRDDKTWDGFCPFHKDYKGTLMVSPGKQIFKLCL